MKQCPRLQKFKESYTQYLQSQFVLDPLDFMRTIIISDFDFLLCIIVINSNWIMYITLNYTYNL